MRTVKPSVHVADDRLLSGAEVGIMKQMRRLNKAEKKLAIKKARALKKLERESYEWASLGE